MQINGFVVLFLICTPVYLLYMKIVHIFLLKKEGEKWWKMLIPFYGKYLLFRMGDRERWYPLYAICMTLCYIAGVVGVFGYVSMIIGMRNGSLSARMTDIYAGGSYMFMEISFVSLVASLVPRFHLAGGMTTRFGMEKDYDYCFGFVVFPFSFQAKMAFSGKMELGEHRRVKKEKKKIKFKMPHFF